MGEGCTRGNGTLTVKKSKPCRAERRKDMYFMLERMAELEQLVKTGENAKKNLGELEEEFKEFCKIELEGDM